MLCIRLQRTGGRNKPTYRLIVANKRSSAKKKPLEIMGFYLPARNPPILEYKKERVEHWMKGGAIPSDTVARILKKSGMNTMDKFTKRYTKKRKKSEEPETDAVPQSAPPAASTTDATPAEKPTEKPLDDSEGKAPTKSVGNSEA